MKHLYLSCKPWSPQIDPRHYKQRLQPSLKPRGTDLDLLKHVPASPGHPDTAEQGISPVSTELFVKGFIAPGFGLL